MIVSRQPGKSFQQECWRRSACASPRTSHSRLSFSNRQTLRVEAHLTHSKQRIAAISNRQETGDRHWQLAKLLREKSSFFLPSPCYIRPRTRVPPHGPARQRPRNPRRAGAFPYFYIEKEPRILLSGTLGCALRCSPGVSEPEGDSCARPYTN